MSFLHNLAELTERCREEYNQIKKVIENEKNQIAYRCSEAYFKDRKKSIDRYENFNILAHGDNLSFIKQLLGMGMEGKLDLVYIDPPFFSKADYNTSLQIQSDKLEKPLKIKYTAYTDCWTGGLEDYLGMLALRLFLIKDLLSDTGCVWVHLDWHAAHYVKLIMDEIFGEENFVNEVIWTYKSGGTTSRRFARKHDTLFFYGKSKNYFFEAQKEKSYNRGMKPYRFKGVEEFEDENGWYTLVNMKDVWQIDMVGRTSSERTGYATQKPEALLERILKSCTKEGDLCADFFGGSGTLAAAADKMNRRWIICDKGDNSAAAIRKRMIKQDAEFIVLEEQKEKKDNIDGRIKKSLSEKDRELLKKALKKDSSCLTDFWSVDFDYDGDIHRPDKVFFRENGRLPEKTEIYRCAEKNEKNIDIQTKQGIQRINIQSVDIFGRIEREAFVK
ncbi:MAG: DNA methyltransferase [Anaerovoracaceae bacterium]